jgi:hypothetical protein
LIIQDHASVPPLSGESRSNHCVAGKCFAGKKLLPEFSKNAVIVAVINKRPTLLERYSLLALERLYLLKYDIVLLQPEGLRYQRKYCRSVEMSRHYFGSQKALASLMISQEFYSFFGAYDYILEHRLDCLVFRDRLAFFCSLGRDYIASAWISAGSGWPQRSFVGFGGLSLRKVSSFERVSRLVSQNPEHARLVKDVVVRYAAEDAFWGRDAPRIDPSFKVCTLEESLRFSFNGSPGPYLRRVRKTPPFGCHCFSLSTKDFIYYNKFVALPSAIKFVWSLALLCLLVPRDLVKLILRVVFRRQRYADSMHLRGLDLQAHYS